MGEFITYLTSSPAGDLISFMAGVKEMYLKTGKKGLIYQRLNMPGVAYSDSIHPFQNEEGAPICMPESMFNMLKPLICSQDYIEDYRIFNGEEIHFSFDLIRLERYTNMPKGSLNRWFTYVFPEMQCDLSKKWMMIWGDIMHIEEWNKKRSEAKIILNFTLRKRNHIIHYHWLKPFQDRLIFAGLQKERDWFCREWDLDIPLLQVDDFLQLAKHLANAKFFMGNESFCFQLCEALKLPRILEAFPMMPTNIPFGEDAYDFYHQDAVIYFFHKLLNK